MKHPVEDQIQIIVFGPGFGESILLHLGNRNWFIIDSCLNDEESPAAISLLKNMGVNVANEVKLVVATHLHADHTGGLYQTIKECKSAKFAVSATLRDENFRAFLEVYNSDSNSIDTTDGKQEILRCLNEVVARSEAPIFVQQDRQIWVASKGELKHKKPVEILALSPSDFQFNAFLFNIGNQMNFLKSKSKTTPVKQREVSLDNENHISIATRVTIGDFSILLGADVEMSNSPKFGWKNIVNNYKNQEPKSHILKLPHHGAESGHSDEMWKFLLKKKPISIIAPWNLAGKSLPTQQDIERIKGFSDSVYITSTESLNFKNTVSEDLLDQISEFGPELYTDFDTCGYVSFLLDSECGKVIEIQFSGNANKL